MEQEILKQISIILTTSSLLGKVEQKTTFSTFKKSGAKDNLFH
jgi:hypothetical protein